MRIFNLTSTVITLFALNASAYYDGLWSNDRQLGQNQYLHQLVTMHHNAADDATVIACSEINSKNLPVASFGDFDIAKSCVDAITMVPNAQAQALRDAIGLPYTQFDKDDFELPSNVPIVTLPSSENLEECEPQGSSRFRSLGGYGITFASCADGQFFFSNSPAAQTEYGFMKALIAKVRALGGIRK